MKNEGLKI